MIGTMGGFLLAHHYIADEPYKQINVDEFEKRLEGEQMRNRPKNSEVTPPEKLEPTDWMSAADTIEVFGALAEGGAEVRFVGGCVRDAILGRAVSDIDLATDAEPNRILELLGEKKIRAVPTGADHGTITAIPVHRPFQITTLRHDVETDGRARRSVLPPIGLPMRPAAISRSMPFPLTWTERSMTMSTGLQISMLAGSGLSATPASGSPRIIFGF